MVFVFLRQTISAWLFSVKIISRKRKNSNGRNAAVVREDEW